MRSSTLPALLLVYSAMLMPSCVTTNSVTTSNDLISVSCQEDIKISLGQLTGISCIFKNTGERPTNVVLRSVQTNSSEAKVLSPKELGSLGQAMRNLQEGQSLAPGTIGFIYFGSLAVASGAGNSGGIQAVIPMALATGFLALAAKGTDDRKMEEAEPQRTYHESHMLHGPFAIEEGESLRREVYVGPVLKQLPESLTMCFDAPTNECLAVPVEADAGRFRQRG